MSTVILAIAFAALCVRHFGSVVQVVLIVRDDVGEARARRQAAMQAWNQRDSQ